MKQKDLKLRTALKKLLRDIDTNLKDSVVALYIADKLDTILQENER